jgi:multicomponent K+:H+ antiporter subunit D
MTSALLGLATAIYSLVRWRRVGVHFYPLFLFLMMGVNGAFLTGDLFNLFVFFEVLLAASYGLALHGSGAARVEASLHYIVVNLVASLLFLIGVSLIYGSSGTLNLAHLAQLVSTRHGDGAGLLDAGVGILLVAFLIKAGAWPLCFWLPRTYAAAPAPSAAMFAILSKVGVYAALRLLLVLDQAGAGPSALFGGSILMIVGFATIAFGSIGILASRKLGRIASHAVLVSSGTVLAALGIANADVTSAALYYMVSSTFAIAALFLLAELVDKPETGGDDPLSPPEVYGEETGLEAKDEGVAFTVTVGTLGVSFICCALVIAGLPPLSGFIGKFALIATAFKSGQSPGIGIWVFVWVLILSGMAAVIAFARAGIRLFWANQDFAPQARLLEILPIAFLIVLCVGQTVYAGPVYRHMSAAGQSLHSPRAYVDQVMSNTRRSPGAR